MEILIEGALGVALLYYWLIGHWFARVLVFLGLEAIALFCFVLQMVFPGFAVAGIILLVAAWPIAGLPRWYWQKEIQRLLRRDISPVAPAPSANSTPHQLEWKAYAERH